VLLFSDGFESGNFSQWTSVSGLTVQQQEVHAGLYGARATSSGTATYAYKDLSPVQNELYYRLWFKILSQGSNSIYLQRFRTGSNGSILGVLVTSTGKLSTRNDVAGVTTTSTTVVSSGAWHELQVRVLIDGAASETEVWLDGTRIDSLSKIENLGTTSVGRIQLGDSSTGRTYDVALDQVALSTQFIGSSNPPGSTATPTRTPTSTSTPTQTSTPTKTSTPTQTSTPTKTSTPTQTSTLGSNPVGAGTYDDTDSYWVYSGAWTAYTGSGPANNTMHYTSTAGDSAELLFNGTKFTLTFTKNSNRGSIDIYVDNVKVTTLNANSSTLAWQQMYTSPTYAAGNHTVRFVHAGAARTLTSMPSRSMVRRCLWVQGLMTIRIVTGFIQEPGRLTLAADLPTTPCTTPALPETVLSCCLTGRSSH